MFLFVLTDAILLKLDLQKRTSVLGNPPNEKLFVYKKWSTYQKIGDVLFFSYIKATKGQCDLRLASVRVIRHKKFPGHAPKIKLSFW